jgi:type I restriction enzyme S subunit
MGREWVEVPFSDAIDFQEGPGILARDFRAHGTPLVRLSGLNRGGSALEGCNYLDPETVAKRWSHFALAKGDVLLSTSASLGRIAIVGEDAIGAIPYTGIIRMRPKSDRVSAGFIRYLLEAPNFQRQAEIVGVGSVIRHFGPMHLRQMTLFLPPLVHQRAIAHILGTLDDKIELTRQMNETLEAMAREHFQSWFASIEVPREKIATLIRTGVIEIGDGYRAKNSELGPEGLPFVRAGDLNNGFDTRGADILSSASVSRAESKISRVGDVAFTSKGTVGRFARVTEYTHRFIYSPQVCFWRSLDAQRLHPVVLYCWMQSGEMLDQLMAVAGQTDMAPYVSLRDQREMRMPMFPSDQHEIAAQIEPILKRQALATEESRTLAALRDTLLPKLISGELRVKDAEKIAARAL